jgi:hypothetical protein
MACHFGAQSTTRVNPAAKIPGSHPGNIQDPARLRDIATNTYTVRRNCTVRIGRHTRGRRVLYVVCTYIKT